MSFRFFRRIGLQQSNAASMGTDIALGSIVDGQTTTGTSLTYSHTLTNENLLIVGFTIFGGGTDRVSSVRHDGTAMTRIGSEVEPLSGAISFLYELASPNTGTHDIEINLTESELIQAASVGYKNAGTHEADNSSNANASSISTSVTVSSAGAWVVGFCANVNSQTYSEGTGTTIRGTATSYNLIDSNGHPGTGAQSLELTTGVSARHAMIVASIPPG